MAQDTQITIFRIFKQGFMMLLATALDSFNVILNFVLIIIVMPFLDICFPKITMMVNIYFILFYFMTHMNPIGQNFSIKQEKADMTTTIYFINNVNHQRGLQIW